MISLDEDGDCIVVRREKTRSLGPLQDRDESVYGDLVLSDMHIGIKSTSEIKQKYIIEMGEHGCLGIFHSTATPLDKVGLQVWRGAAVLVDYLLSLTHLIHGSVILELGAGTGLVSLAAGLIGVRAAFATDAFDDVLSNCLRNVESNGLKGRVFVRHLDWMESSPWLALGTAPPPHRTTFSWQLNEIQQLGSVDMILAADVIYDDTLTEGLMRLALMCMTPPRRGHEALPCVMYVAVERRECFTLRDMDVKAPAYQFWRSLFVDAEASSQTGESKRGVVRVGSWALIGKRIDLGDIPKCVHGYERTHLLELWELKVTSI